MKVSSIRTLATHQRRPGRGLEQLATASATGALERLIFLSDGVFAIALTLLVVSLSPPDSSADLAARLWDVRARVVSFAISFLVIASFWVGHQRAFGYLARVNGRLTRINLLFLLLIAFQPFPTAVLGVAGDTSLAVTLYASTLIVTSGLLLLLWVYAARAGLFRADADRKAIEHHTYRAATTPVVFAISIVIAQFSPTWAEISWIGIAVAFGVLQRLYARATR